MYHGFGVKLVLIFEQSSMKRDICKGLGFGDRLPKSSLWSSLQDSEIQSPITELRWNRERASQEALDTLLCPKANHGLRHVAFLYCENAIPPYPRAPWFVLSEKWDWSPCVPLQYICQAKWELGLETKLVTQTRALNSFPWAMFPFHRNLAEVRTFRSTNLVHPTDVR